MRTELIIVDDFYTDPLSVRNLALSQPFETYGNYPGARTKPFIDPSIISALESVVYHAGGKITKYDYEYTGAFQICTSSDRTWIHADNYNTWAAVCYLTPNAPISGGTALYKHKKSGETCFSGFPHETQDYTKWDVHAFVGNIFNRLVVYRGDLFHASVDYFGSSSTDGRLFQTFFFDTEY